MKLEKASYEIWDEKIPLHDHIERCGRICYASEPKYLYLIRYGFGDTTLDIGVDEKIDGENAIKKAEKEYLNGNKAVRRINVSSEKFVSRLIKSGHLSVLEHGTIYLKMDPDSPDSAKYYDDQYSEHYVDEEDNAYITANYRRIVESNWLKDLKYLCEPTSYHDKRITVKWNVNRAIANEIVRHRKFSFSQQSTRYCNFSKDRFNNELTFIIPSWIDENEIVKEFGGLNGLSYHKDIDRFQASELANESNFLQSIAFSEANYLTLLKNGLKPEQARDVLPLALKTELVMTGFSHDWYAFFKLRCDNHAHPDIRLLAIELRNEFYKKGYLV